MTYKELLEKLRRLTPEQLDMRVSVYACDENFSFGDEVFPVNDLLTGDKSGYRIDADEIYLVYYK
jgi:hypothetical protein